MMKSSLLTFLALTLMIFSVKGQQLPVHGLNFFNPLLYNPAITGSIDNNQIFLLNRTQWKEFNGPEFKIATFDFRVPKMPFSTGLIFQDQQSGAFSTTKAKLNYTHHLQLTENLILLLGFSGGIALNKFNVNEINAIRIDDPVLNSGERTNVPDFDGGAMLKGKSFKAGITLVQLEGDMFAGNETTAIPQRHVVVSADYKWNLNADSTFILTPMVMARSAKGTSLLVDGNLSISWKNILWIGAGYKNNYAAQFNAGLQLKNFRAGYSYELPVNSLKGFIPPVHEIGLGYVFRSYSQSKQKKTDNVKPRTEKSGKQKNITLEDKEKELELLLIELSEREDNLIRHERQIYSLIDSLYTKANKESTNTNEEELEKMARTQKEVNRIKEELKQYTKEKNVELFHLKQQIDALRREIDELRN